MNRTPEMVAAEAIEEFWQAVGKRSGAGVTGNPLQVMSQLERHAFDAAVASMVVFLQLRTARLCAEGEAKQ